MSQVFDHTTGSAAGRSLEITVRSVGPCTVIALEGEFTSAGEPVLRDCLEAVMGTGCRQVVLDLADLAFGEPDGLSALVRSARLVKRRGGTLELRSERPWPYQAN